MLDEHKSNVLNIIKWFFLATGIGCVIGVLDAAFLKALDASIAFRNKIPLFYLGLPFALYLVVVLSRKVAKKDKDFSTDAVLHQINAYESISFISVLKGFFLSIVTMATGGSAGKEAPCADTGAGVSALIAKLLRMNPADRRKMMICGVSAGFAGVFGVPISGALFGLEVLWVGHIFYEVMFPALVAGITAFQVTSYLGVNYIYHPLHFVPVFSEQFFLKMIIAGMFFGLVALLFIELLKFMRVVFRFIALRTRPFWACFIGGLVLLAIGHFISPLYLGLGMAGIDGPLNGQPVSAFGFLYKMISTAVTFAAGGIGGIVTPIFFVGAQAGAMLADVLKVDSATLAALGLVAVLAGAANTPLAASIMAIELFGPAIAPYATVACVISFLVTGEQSVYPSQRISWDSGKALNGHTSGNPPQYRRRSTDQRTHVRTRKTLFKKVVKEMTRHLIPNTKGFDEKK